MAGYSATLKDGSEIYIPAWPVTVALENLTLAGQVLGSENVVTIAELNTAAVVVGIMQASDAHKAAKLLTHFVCQVRIDGKKIEAKTIDSMFESKLELIVEMFAHVMHSQFSSFFELGLAKAVSPEAT